MSERRPEPPDRLRFEDEGMGTVPEGGLWPYRFFRDRAKRFVRWVGRAFTVEPTRGGAGWQRPTEPPPEGSRPIGAPIMTREEGIAILREAALREIGIQAATRALTELIDRGGQVSRVDVIARTAIDAAVEEVERRGFADEGERA